jgi:transcriptional regulator with XRE-family HTH domain
MTQNARAMFASNLRRERKRLNFTQEDLGFRCGINVSAVSRLERATREPLLATIVKLGNALGIPPAQLLEGIP